MDQHIITVVVPAYNVERYIGKCLTSIISQTHKYLQIIVVDDGSTDRTVSIIKKFTRHHKNIILVEQKNSGPGIARNSGLERAKGKYICFVDSDDWLDPGYVDALLLEAERTQADVVIGAAWEAHDNERILIANYVDASIRYLDMPIQWKDAPNVFLANTPVWDKLFRTDFLISGNIRFLSGTAEDIIFKWQFLLKAKRISVVPEPYYFYRVRRGSITSGKEISSAVFKIHELVRTLLKSEQVDEELYAQRATMEILETIYLTRKAADVFASDAKVYSEYYDNLKNQLSNIEIKRIRALLPSIPPVYLMQALYVTEVNSKIGLLNIINNSKAAEKKFKSLAIGKYEFLISATKLNDRIASTPIQKDIEDTLAKWVTKTSSDIEYYDGLPDHQCATFDRTSILMIPPPYKSHSRSVVATISIKSGHDINKIYFIADAFQDERDKSLALLINVKGEYSDEVIISKTVELPLNSPPQLVCLDIPSSLLKKGFDLQFSLNAEDDHAYYTATRIYSFYAEVNLGDTFERWVTKKSADIEHYDGLPEHRCVSFNKNSIIMIPPPHRSRSRAAVATVSVKSGHDIDKFYFIADAFQSERDRSLSLSIILKSEYSDETRFSEILDLPLRCGPRLICITIPNSLINQAFRLQLSLDADDNNAFYTATSIHSFYAVNKEQ